MGRQASLRELTSAVLTFKYALEELMYPQFKTIGHYSLARVKLLHLCFLFVHMKARNYQPGKSKADIIARASADLWADTASHKLGSMVSTMIVKALSSYLHTTRCDCS